MAHEPTEAAADEEDIPQIAQRGGREGRERRVAAGRQDGRGRAPAHGMTRLFFGIGRGSGVRPQDLVGAIAGESRLTGRDIGAIEIAERFSLAEVPEAAADEVIAALRRSTIKGRKVRVRRERESPDGRG
jgi:ATP-dependent RNA helicase DeaD